MFYSPFNRSCLQFFRQRVHTSRQWGGTHYHMTHRPKRPPQLATWGRGRHSSAKTPPPTLLSLWAPVAPYLPGFPPTQAPTPRHAERLQRGAALDRRWQARDERRRRCTFEPDFAHAGCSNVGQAASSRQDFVSAAAASIWSPSAAGSETRWNGCWRTRRTCRSCSQGR